MLFHQTTIDILHRVRKTTLNFTWDKKSPYSQDNPKQKNSWRHQPDFKLYYKTTVAKAATEQTTGSKNRHIGNGTE